MSGDDRDLSQRIARLSPQRRALLERVLAERRAAPAAAPAIPRRGTTEPPPLSTMQEGIWLADHLAAAASYNRPCNLELHGPLDVAALERALAELFRRQDVLRSRFPMIDHNPVQIVEPPAAIALPVIDLRRLDPPARDTRARELALEEADRPLDLQHGPVARCTLLRRDDDDHLLLFTVHHIACDGISHGILTRELAQLYDACARGVPPELPELPIQYADFAAWQRQRAFDEQLAYWQRRLEACPPLLELPTDRVAPPRRTQHGANEPVRIAAPLVAKLRRVARDERATLFMTLLAGYQVLLHRYSRMEDLLVGCPVAGRGRREVEGLVGLFANTLVFRTDVSGEPSFRELLARVRRSVTEALQHADPSLEQLVSKLPIERVPSHPPLVQVVFALQTAPSAVTTSQGLTFTPVEPRNHAAKFDLALSLFTRDDHVTGELQYATDLFDTATAARMARSFTTLLEGVAAEPDCRIGELPLMTAAERREQLDDWNRTDAPGPDRCIHELFSERATERGDSVAVEIDDQQLSYRELDRRANQLAYHLAKLGVGREVLVGISVERSLEMIVGMLGVLKAGGAFLPLDPAYPRDRLAFMIEDSRIAVLLTQRRLVDQLPPHGAHVVCLDEWEAIAGERDDAPRATAARSDLAYVIYTSGSTGRPKGVMVEHRGIPNLCAATAATLGIAADSRMLQFASFSFDAAINEVFTILCAGGTLCMGRTDSLRPGPPLAELIRRHRARIAVLPPSALAVMTPDELADLRTLAVAGEPCPSKVTLAWAPGRRFFNFYGPTEATVMATTAECTAGGRVTIGRPIANTRAYLLDRHLSPVPIGVAAELYIGGIGVARGYLGREQLTAERFIPNPFRPGERLYRTGDLARYHSDGNIEFLGRTDHQVKLRGFRIELGEIESLLGEHPSVREAVVAAREDVPGHKRLVAYVVAATESLSWSELRDHLKTKLPDYMVPGAFVKLEALPLSPNGKLDRRALPAPDAERRDASTTFVPPRSPEEELVASLWRQLLGVNRVGIHDDFFELGGNSLLVMQLASQLRATLHRELPLQDFFEAPTIAGVTAALERAESRSGPPIVALGPREARGHDVASYGEERIWRVQKRQPGRPVVNLKFGLRLSGALDVTALERTLAEVMRRQAMLRARFSIIVDGKGGPADLGGRLVRRIAPPGTPGLRVVDLGGIPDAEREAAAAELADREGAALFDLTSDEPLVRFTLARLGPAEHLFLCTLHHIIADGWSINLLIGEIAEVYAAYTQDRAPSLPRLPIEYADYAAWQREHLVPAIATTQGAYWHRQLDGAPEMPLPTRPHADRTSVVAASEVAAVPIELLAQFKRLARREGSTMFSVLFTGFAVVLHKWSGAIDLAVGTPVAGRLRPEAEPLIGYFLNHLALRTDLSGDPTFRELLARVHAVAGGAFANQELPVREILGDACLRALYQVRFNFQSLDAPFSEPVERMGALALHRIKPPSLVTGMDVSLYLNEHPDHLALELRYKRDLFQAEAAAAALRGYLSVLAAAVEAPERRLASLCAFI